jgi:hypothetical protein
MSLDTQILIVKEGVDRPPQTRSLVVRAEMEGEKKYSPPLEMTV